jgi:hypothetical protein
VDWTRWRSRDVSRAPRFGATPISAVLASIPMPPIESVCGYTQARVPTCVKSIFYGLVLRMAG